MAATKGRKPATKNAGHGGKRAGAGRPRDTMPADVIAKLGERPTTFKELRLWNARFAAEIAIGEATGTIGPELAARLRVNVGAIQKLLPAIGVDDLEEPDDDGDEEVTGDAGAGAALRVPTR